jgi:uncharacterized repeat protein (TIGR03803 family)
VRDSNGNLYGSTEEGGAAGGVGTVFEVSATGVETVLHTFTGGSDESYPSGNLLLDANGNLYGTTEGGSANGTVFKLLPGGNIGELHIFAGSPSDGANPEAGVIRDSAGNLYGTTLGGGANGNFGTVFEVSKDKTETVLYSFAAGSDGEDPLAGLVRDAAGNLYGTTAGGGGVVTGDCDMGVFPGCGTVFEVTPDGQETVLYRFTGRADGGNPFSDLVLDSKGNLYGTASAGGSAGLGVVFEVTPAGKEKVLHTFTGYPDDGSVPYGGLLHLGNYLYGTTSEGGPEQCGTVYKITP